MIISPPNPVEYHIRTSMPHFLPINIQAKGKPKILENPYNIIHASLFRSHNDLSIVGLLAKFLLDKALSKRVAFNKTSHDRIVD